MRLERLTRVTLFGAACALGFAAPGQIAAQEGKSVRRELSGHYFLPNVRGKDAFVNSYVRSSTSLGIAYNVSVPFFNLAGDPVSVLEGDLAFMRLGFEFQQAVADWLAFRVSFGGSARIGTDEQALLSSGISAIQNAGLGASVRFFESDKVYVSGTLDLNGSTLFFVDPLAFVQDVVDRGELDPESANNLAGDEKNFRTSAGVRAAYSPAPWIGFTGFGEAGFGDPFEDADNTELLGSVQFGTSLDFGELSGVPVGLLIEFLDDSFSQNGEDLARSVRTWSFGLHYTGARDFSLALTPRVSKIPLKSNDVTINALIFDISMRYFF